MIPAELKAALDDYARSLRAVLSERVHDIRLFGSWARGEADPEESDIDVWILVDRRDDIAIDAAVRLTTPILMKHHLTLSPTVMDEKEWRLLNTRERLIASEIRRDGIAL